MNIPSITPEYEKEAAEFYTEFLKILNQCQVPFVISGTYAVRFYTGIKRPTKDIDIFCKASDYPKILKKFQDLGYEIEVLDDRWIAKITKGEYFADIIFGFIPNFSSITDSWIENAVQGEILGSKVLITPPEELIVSKMYRQGRNQFDGADVLHIILKCAQNLDWDRLMKLAEPNWEVLFSHLITFRFVYPSERDLIPQNLMKEYLNRIKLQMELPTPIEKVSRGSLLSHTQFQIDYTDWGYKDVNEIYERGSMGKTRSEI